jgi:hypothetical protein
MINPASYERLKQEIAERMAEDYGILEQLRNEMRPLRDGVRQIQPRTTTSIALVATDGGINSLSFDPFLVQIVRVVDSNNKELCLNVATPTTSVSKLSHEQFYENNTPRTPLGKMMAYLDVQHLSDLSPMIKNNDDGRPISPSWVQVYRELVEWAILFDLVRNTHFGNDTLVVVDGLLRSIVFHGDLFHKYLDGITEGIEQQHLQHRRRIYLAGVAKHSKVLSRYRLAMALEGILETNYPAYLAIPSEIEKNAYVWAAYARQDEQERSERKISQFVGGKMFFVKFGSGPRDAIWPVDIFLRQASEAHTILGHLLADALNGFPIPAYPLCLQKAHVNAAMIDFDFDIIQRHIIHGIRHALATEAPTLDTFRLRDTNPAQRRYH